MYKSFSLLLLAALPFWSHAQAGNFLNKVKSRVQQKVEQRVDNKIDRNIDRGLDEIEGKTPADNSVTSASQNESSPTGKAGLQNYSKYDFIPGEKILYAEDFLQDELNELPLQWNTNGSGETVKLDGLPGNWLRLHQPFVYLSGNQQPLPANFTAEFDLILQLKNNGWMYPTFSFGFFDSNGLPAIDNSFLKDYRQHAALQATIYPAENSTSRILLEQYSGGESIFKSAPKNYGELDRYYGQPVHVAVQVQQQRFRMWINGAKLFDLPKLVDTSHTFNQLLFAVGQTNYKEDQYAVYISNLKTATGLPDTRHKLLEEGKFSTTGIQFAVNSAEILPASYGVIREIGTLLKSNSGLQIKIVGHTSSDGDDAANLELSKKRATAVKALLVKDFGIDPAAVVAEGRGETAPVADNTTKEGKALNRRVEFIKM